MKQLYYTIVFLCLFIFPVVNVTAQTCSSTFTVSTTSTPSTCQANGTITVTLNGDVTNLSSVQYGLTTSTGAAVINPQESNVLTNIPAGTYTVSVRAFCQVDANYNVVKTVSNVVVGGNYKVPSASFNAASSRKSYDVCNTGIIVLNVTDGSGTFTFNITSAPAGVATGIITPTKSGTTYTLPGQNYPAGNYTIQIQDGCYTSVATFTLGQVSGYPLPNNTTSSGFYPILTDGICNQVNLYASSVSNSNADYYRYYQDGMYEVGAAAVGNMPIVWTPWISANLVSGAYLTLDISPSTYSNFYTANSLSVYTRLKGCPTGYTSYNSNFYNPIMNNTYISRDCNNYVYKVSPYSVGYYNMICYPAAVSVTKTIGGAVIYSNPSWSYDVNGIPVTLDYDTGYTITITGSNGKVITSSVNTNRNILFTNNLIDCSTYQLQYAVPSANTCWPVNVTIKDATGKVICTDEILNSTSYRPSCPLNYGQTYTFTAVYGNGYTYTTTKSVASTLPTVVNFSRNYSNACIEDNGYFYTSVSSGTPWPAGTKFTVTGPAGYTTQTYTSTSSAWYYYWPTTTIPAGNYTLTTDYGCGTPVVTQLIQRGVYSGKALGYTTENTCAGMKVTPTGSMTYESADITTYYRLTNGPTGYDKTVITTGGSFIFSAPGTYTLGILNTNSATACVINTKTIVYTAPPLALDNTGTSAYECVDNVTGIILLKAINGVAPYTYQLWDEANTTKLVAIDLVSSGQVHFNYGEAEHTYTARIKDQCGNEFSQKVTLAKLSTARIVNADPSSVCTGETIVLKCTTLGNTAYNWTGPNGYTSTAQNPTIPNATASMSGWYKVSVMPEFCGEAVKDSAYVTVYAPLTAGTVALPQAVCVRTPANTLSGAITGGSGAYTYQWQTSANGTTGWTNISGATAANYMPPVKIQSGANYYRVVVTDRCGTVNGNPITVNSTPCYLPVNPNIRSRGGR